MVPDHREISIYVYRHNFRELEETHDAVQGHWPERPSLNPLVLVIIMILPNLNHEWAINDLCASSLLD